MMTVFTDRTVFNPQWRFFKGNLHCHTTVSDGSQSHERLIERYEAQGYGFVCFSDHDVYTDLTKLDTPEFITLPGVEWSGSPCEGNSWQKVHHVHGIAGTQKMLAAATRPPLERGERLPEFPYGGAETVGQMCSYLLERGCFTMYNHPLWSRTAPADFGPLTGFTALEIYNYGCDLENHTAYGDVYWDQLLSGGSRLSGVASDDNHNHSLPDDSFGGWICVNAPALTHDDIVRGILDGHFYSSSGPVIHQIGVKDGRVFVECEPVHHINFVAGGKIALGASVWSVDGSNGLRNASYELRGRETYVRVECVDAAGRAAWSNPIFPDGVNS